MWAQLGYDPCPQLGLVTPRRLIMLCFTMYTQRHPHAQVALHAVVETSQRHAGSLSGSSKAMVEVRTKKPSESWAMQWRRLEVIVALDSWEAKQPEAISNGIYRDCCGIPVFYSILVALMKQRLELPVSYCCCGSVAAIMTRNLLHSWWHDSL